MFNGMLLYFVFHFLESYFHFCCIVIMFFLHTDRFYSYFLNLQGVLGIKVKIMLDWDPKGKTGPVTPLPDLVTIHQPKEEEEYVAPLVHVPDELNL